MAAEVTPVPVENLPPSKIAFVIDGKVVDVLHTDVRLAAILLSQPTIVDASTWMKDNPGINLVDASYDGTIFTPVVNVDSLQEYVNWS